MCPKSPRPYVREPSYLLPIGRKCPILTRIGPVNYKYLDLPVVPSNQLIIRRARTSSTTSKVQLSGLLLVSAKLTASLSFSLSFSTASVVILVSVITQTICAVVSAINMCFTIVAE